MSPMGDPLLGRERVKQFTYDHSYMSVDDTKPNYASQEQVIDSNQRFQKWTSIFQCILGDVM